jgi:hypothetical protein
MIDLTIHEKQLKRTFQRARERITIIPTRAGKPICASLGILMRQCSAFP